MDQGIFRIGSRNDRPNVIFQTPEVSRADYYMTFSADLQQAPSFGFDLTWADGSTERLILMQDEESTHRPRLQRAWRGSLEAFDTRCDVLFTMRRCSFLSPKQAVDTRNPLKHSLYWWELNSRSCREGSARMPSMDGDLSVRSGSTAGKNMDRPESTVAIQSEFISVRKPGRRLLSADGQMGQSSSRSLSSRWPDMPEWVDASSLDAHTRSYEPDMQDPAALPPARCVGVDDNGTVDRYLRCDEL
jgi:hypothetical protein